MQPTIGRVVVYTLDAHDAFEINRRREHASNSMHQHRVNANGVQVHVGNSVHPGQQFPMIVVRVWEQDLINGQVLLDGNDTYWATSVREGEGEHQWSWPVIQPKEVV